MNCFLVAAYSEDSSTEDAVEVGHGEASHKAAVCLIIVPIIFLIIPDALLPILNLPEFRMFMAICPTRSKPPVKTPLIGDITYSNLP